MIASTQRAAEERSLSDLVVNQIHEAPGLKDAAVSASADHGIVTLTGCVRTEAERIAVEGAARQVRSVAAIADDLKVRPALERSSAEIAKDILARLRGHIFLASEEITIIVRDGRVILEGFVHQEIQKMLAAALARRVRGISGISNQLEVRPDATTDRTISEQDVEAVNGFGNGWVDTGEAEAG